MADPRPTWNYEQTTVGFAPPRKGSNKRRYYDELRAKEVRQAEAAAAITPPVPEVPEIKRKGQTAGEEYDALPAKPLTASDRKNLERIVMGEFNQAEQQVHTLAQQYLQKGLKEIEDTYGDDTQKREEVVARVTAWRRAVEDGWKEFVASLREEFGFEPVANRSYGTVANLSVQTPNTWNPVGKDKAVRALQVEVDTAKQAAWDSLRRSRSEAERQILLAGVVNPAALALLDSVPKAPQLFAAVQAQAALTAGAQAEQDARDEEAYYNQD